MINAIRIALYAPVEVDGHWYVQRNRWSGGWERILQEFGNRSAALVMAEILNSELKAYWKQYATNLYPRDG